MNQKRYGSVALVGLPNAGKSSILNAIIGQKIAPVSFKAQTTRQSIRGIWTKENTQIVFIDTPGLMEAEYELQSYMQKQTLSSANDVDVLVWVSDVAHILAKADHRASDLAYLKTLLQRLNRDKKNVLWVLNKMDYLKDKSVLLPLIEEAANLNLFSAVVPVSAKTNAGLDDLFCELAKKLPEQEFLFDADAVTDTFERQIVAEFIREKALNLLDNEVPYQIAVNIESFDEKRKNDLKKPLVEIEAVLYVEREGQKKIVIGKNGEKIKQIGIAARQEIELLLQCQVMLKLFVRVQPRWTQVVKKLKKLGFV
jgi:GTPase